MLCSKNCLLVSAKIFCNISSGKLFKSSPLETVQSDTVSHFDMASQKFKIFFTVFILTSAVVSMPVFDMIPQRKPDPRTKKVVYLKEKRKEVMEEKMTLVEKQRELDDLLHLLSPSSFYYNIQH